MLLIANGVPGAARLLRAAAWCGGLGTVLITLGARLWVPTPVVLGAALLAAAVVGVLVGPRRPATALLVVGVPAVVTGVLTLLVGSAVGYALAASDPCPSTDPTCRPGPGPLVALAWGAFLCAAGVAGVAAGATALSGPSGTAQDYTR